MDQISKDDGLEDVALLPDIILRVDRVCLEEGMSANSFGTIASCGTWRPRQLDAEIV